MRDKFAKLNRLRVNAGKAELKSWKASEVKLDETITKLEAAGFVDTIPGANPDAPPVIDDPAVAKARPLKEEEEEPKDAKDKEPTKYKPGLGRGLHNEPYARSCRKAIQDHRRREKAEAKKARLSDKEKRAIEEEAEFRKGRVDPKKDPEKAKRQQEKIAAKQAARKAAGKTAKKREVGDDQITAADIARSLGIDPKIARAKLRRYEDKPEYPKPVEGERWVFPKSAEKALTKILK